MLSVKNNPHTVWIKKRIKQNKNAIGVFLGSTGSGKTYGALDFAINLAKELDTSFTIENNLAFDFRTMLKKMELAENNKAGTVFVLEEVGAVGSGGASSEWMSKANAFFSSFLQTSRHRNQILIFTTPNYSLLTKQARQLIHFSVEMLSINKDARFSTGRFKICQTNPITGKTYMKYLRILDGTQKIAIPMIRFRLPPSEVLEVYEAEKTKYTDQLNKMILEILEENNNKKDKREQDKANDLLDKERAYKMSTEDNMSIIDISLQLGRSRNTISTWLKQLRYQYAKIRKNDNNALPPPII